MKTLLVSLLILTTACTYANNINLIIPTTKPQFTVSLPANPTTGYQWRVTKFDKTRFTLTQNKYLPAQTKLIGAGGTMQYTFSLKKSLSYPKQTQMIFTYGRPWEANSDTDTKVNITFNR